jgi:hypothetical protein
MDSQRKRSPPERTSNPLGGRKTRIIASVQRHVRHLVLLALTVLGCADVVQPTTAADRAALDRETHLDDLPSGQASSEDAVVRVISNGTLCSGAVVGAELVLTAGHCVVGQRAGYVYIELGQAALPWGRVGARDVMVCDGYEGGFERDIGFVVLDRQLPHDVPRLHVYADEGDLGAAGMSFVSRGFGAALVSSQVPDYGATWSTHGVARKGTFKWSTGDAFALDMRSFGGDSGSPVLAEGSHELVGVTSHRTEGSDGLTYVSRISACRQTLARARDVARFL